MFSNPVRQLALQGAAVIFVLSLAWPYYGWQAQAMPWQQTSLFIGAAALLLSTIARQPWWWRLIHAGFMPLVWLTHSLRIDPLWFLLAFMLLLLVYRGALTGQIPLYLSNPETVEALDAVLAGEEARSFLDLGAGLGSTVSPLARRWANVQFTGVENAPLTWLAGRLRTAGQANLHWRYGDLWQTPLAGQDVVYAFLSPAPMAELWEKARREMRPGSLFISNSFEIPGVPPAQVLPIDCIPPRTLFCYRL